LTDIGQIQLSEKQRHWLFKLWNSQYPAAIAFAKISDLDLYLNSLIAASHYIPLDDENKPLAWICTFTREQELWFAMIIDPDYQGKGLGKKLLSKLKMDFPALNAWVVDHSDYVLKSGEPYHSPLGFYLKLGFKIASELPAKKQKISVKKIIWRA
jgi:GNAT superfamily N-acetyltransferase